MKKEIVKDGFNLPFMPKDSKEKDLFSDIRAIMDKPVSESQIKKETAHLKAIEQKYGKEAVMELILKRN